MRNILCLQNLFILLYLFPFGCAKEHSPPTTKYEIPSLDHHLSYIPYDAKLDNPEYTICDSTSFNSGRNRIQYNGGTNKLRKDILSNYLFHPEYASFNGYIVIRFLVNCEGKSGRYRAQSLNLDFSSSSAPSGLLQDAIALIKSLDNWTKSSAYESKAEYSKFINLKIQNGEIQHVLL